MTSALLIANTQVGHSLSCRNQASFVHWKMLFVKFKVKSLLTMGAYMINRCDLGTLNVPPQCVLRIKTADRK